MKIPFWSGHYLNLGWFAVPVLFFAVIGTVNGVNFTGIYGGTRAMGWQNIKLPEGYTWKEYMYFLLDTLPEETKQSYLEKLRVSREFWKYKGGCLDLSTIRKLTDLGIKFYVQKKTNYKTDKLPVQMDYLDDIDIAEFKEIPTYKRMCICILKNDHVCKYMGFALTKKEKLRRDRVMQKYKNIIK
jgi:predicted phosphoadenosine phosphosulfate sulfurtransferase